MILIFVCFPSTILSFQSVLFPLLYNVVDKNLKIVIASIIIIIDCINLLSVVIFERNIIKTRIEIWTGKKVSVPLIV